MCGNRLKRWNTMPTLSRILLRSVVRSWAAKPLTTTSPSLTVSGVHAAQEGAFPRAGWADDAHHFLRFNIAADAAQHVAVAEALM